MDGAELEWLFTEPVWVWAAPDADVPLELQPAAARPTPSAAVATPMSLDFIAIVPRSEHMQCSRECIA
jgi:hypothetical protein